MGYNIAARRSAGATPPLLPGYWLYWRISSSSLLAKCSLLIYRIIFSATASGLSNAPVSFSVLKRGRSGKSFALLDRIVSCILVSMTPGASDTSLAWGASRRATRVYMSSAALVAQYTPQPAVGERPAPDEILTTRTSAPSAWVARSRAVVSNMALVTFRLNVLEMA